MMRTLSEIESLIASRRLDDAVAALEEFLAKSPDDAEARMLLGICGQLKGDTDSFCEVYRELAPSLDARAKAGEESPVMARWRHYLRVASYLMTLGIITLTGTGYARIRTVTSETGCFNAERQSALEDVKLAGFQAIVNDPSVARMAEEDPDGCRIFIGEDGSMKVISTGTGVYDFNDEDEVQDARKEATRNAKVHIVKFFKENFSTEEQATNATKKAKSMHKDGENELVSVSKETLKTTVEVVKSGAEKVLSGVVVLKEEKIPSSRSGGSGGTIRVTVGVKTSALRAPRDEDVRHLSLSRYNMGGRWKWPGPRGMNDVSTVTNRVPNPRKPSSILVPNFRKYEDDF